MWTEIRNSFYKLKADLALKASAKRAPVINPYVEKLDYLWEKRGKKMTVEEVEKLYLVSDVSLGPDPVPFGFINHRWQELLAKMQDGDELWSYSDYHGGRSGSEGIALCRGPEVVAAIVTVRF